MSHTCQRKMVGNGKVRSAISELDRMEEGERGFHCKPSVSFSMDTAIDYKWCLNSQAALVQMQSVIDSTVLRFSKVHIIQLQVGTEHNMVL